MWLVTQMQALDIHPDFKPANSWTTHQTIDVILNRNNCLVKETQQWEKLKKCWSRDRLHKLQPQEFLNGWSTNSPCRPSEFRCSQLTMFRNRTRKCCKKGSNSTQSLVLGSRFEVIVCSCEVSCQPLFHPALLLRDWYEIIALYNIKSILTDF